jgi:hypothetical protein
VALTSGNFTFANARTDGYDVQFRATDGSTVLRSWREAYDDGTDTAAFWVKVPSVPSNSTTTIRLYYGNPFAPDDSDITAVFPFAEDFRDIATARANLTAGVTIGSTLSPTLANSSANGEIITHGGTGYRQAEVREQSNIVWTGTEYVFLFTGVDASGQSTTGLCTAPDITGPWTEYGSTYVLPQSEDAYITVTDDGDLYTDGSGWHFVMYERKLTTGTANDDISIARTKNFRTDWEVWNSPVTPLSSSVTLAEPHTTRSHAVRRPNCTTVPSSSASTNPSKSGSTPPVSPDQPMVSPGRRRRRTRSPPSR